MFNFEFINEKGLKNKKKSANHQYSDSHWLVIQVASMVLVGDAKGKIAILIDDMADTCGTIVQVM